MASLVDIGSRPKLSSESVGKHLAQRIRGRADVECLRRLIAGTWEESDFANALALCSSELRAVAYEDWGPPPWTYQRTARLREADDILRLRADLMLGGNAFGAMSSGPVAPEIEQAPELPIPCPDGREYMPFQRLGIAFAAGRTHALIADEPGLGKTIQAVGVVNALEPSGRIVVVCPASLRINWTREIEAWLCSPRSIAISQANDLPDTQVVVIGYSTVDRHVDALVSRGIGLLVLDESHAIKSATSARTKACAALIAAAERGIYLSGTPLLNRPVELEPLLKAIGSPIAAGYQKRYCDARMKDVYVRGPGRNKRRVWDANGASNLEELGRRLRGEDGTTAFMIRRLKADVLTELPEKRRRVLALDVVGTDALISRGAAALSEIDLDAYVSGKRPPPMDASEIALIRHEEALAKLPVAMDYAHELLEDEGVGKLVIFAYHRDVLEGIVTALKDFGPALLYGGMSDIVKQVAVDRFQTAPECRVFVGSIQAAGVGITLTAASRVLMVELDWVPAIVTQAEDRCHRKGQRDSVLVEHLVLPGGIDDRIARALLRKQEILDRTLSPVTA